MQTKRIFFLLPFLLLAYIPLFAQEITFTPEEQAWIDAHPVIEFGNDPHWEPYEMIEDGEYTGIVFQFIKEIEKFTGIDMVPIEDLTWTETMDGLKKGTINVVANATVTPERLSYLEFSNPYITDPHIIATRKDYEFVGSLFDLEDKKITIPKNYFSIELISKAHPSIEIVLGENVEDCLEKLSYGEVDAFVGALGVASYYINNKGYTNLKIAAPTDYENVKMSMVVTKDWKTFITIANKIFATITPERKVALKKEWISVRYDHGITWKEAFYWIGLIGGILLAGFTLFYLWNRSLAKQVLLRTKSEERLAQSVHQIKLQDEEKSVLLQEIHHRVKNNLQIITSLIRLQASNSDDETAVASLNESVDRIRAIALIHDRIYNSTNLDQISTQAYVESLVNEVVENFSNEKKVDLEVNSTATSISLKSIVPLALILNELITNSLKYGLRDKTSGKISVQLKETEEILSMRYFDNGKWIENESKNESFGTSLIDIFTDQLDGSYQLNKLDLGTEYLFKFKTNIY